MYPADPEQVALLNQKTLRLATLWKIERTDGVTLYLTNHDLTIVAMGSSWVPNGGFDSSAKKSQVALKNNTLQVEGFINSDQITAEDLRARRYDNAEVTEYIVDWMFPNRNSPMFQTVFFIDRVRYTDSTWKAELHSVSHLLEKKAGHVLSKTCETELGSDECTINMSLSTNRTTETVKAITNPGDTDKYQFTIEATTFGFASPSRATNGKVEFTSGDNDGITATISAISSSPSDVIVTLYGVTPFNIQVGDAVTVFAGCNKLFNGDCQNKFSNRINFQGRPHAPGTLKMVPLKV